MAPSSPSDRLNGWKEIASFLGKGVRTVQRWEKELGLPVRRLGKEGGEIVFAFRSEIDAWALTSCARNGVAADAATNGNGDGQGDGNGSGNAPAAVLHESTAARAATAAPGLARGGEQAASDAAERAPKRHGVRWWHLGTLGFAASLLVVLGVGAWRGLPLVRLRGEARSPSNQPHEWAVERDRLRLFAADGRFLWEHHFASGVAEDHYRWEDHQRWWAIAIDDLDGGGDHEVMFVGSGLPRGSQALFVFNSDGSTRFVLDPVPSVRFGETTYGPHWIPHGVRVTRAATGKATMWAWFIHGLWFPTLVQQLDAAGNPVSHYWSNGYVEFVGTGTFGGRPVVLVGGTNNEHRGASLAVFDGSQVRGSAPASKTHYRCTDCPPGGPSAFLVIPRICLARTKDATAFVRAAHTDASGRIVVQVEHAAARLNERDQSADVYYTFGPGPTLERVELTREFLRIHEAEERAGRLDHPFGPADERSFFPVLRWERDRFVPLPPAPIAR